MKVLPAAFVGAGVSSPAAAIAEVRQTAADDPLNAWVTGMHSFALGFAGRHAEAVTEAERALELDPGSFFAQWGLMRAVAWSGDFARAIAMAPGLLASSGRHPWALGTLGWALGRAGHAEKARAVCDELTARSRHEFVSAFWLAAVAAAVGRGEDARRYAERSVAERDPIVVLARLLPQWDYVRELPWFEEVVRGVWG